MNFLMLTSKRLTGLIKQVAFQGVVIGILPFIFTESISWQAIILSTVTIILKGFIFPWFFYRAIKKAKINTQIEPYIGYTASVLIGLAALFFSFWIAKKLILPPNVSSLLVLPASFFTIFIGLFLIISRTKAITQALSYLITENGIYMFSYAFLIEQSILVELGILLDVFVAVFIMGITIFHIKKQFDHLDTRYLSQLKD
jgi:hydrogenase-4 component E